VSRFAQQLPNLPTPTPTSSETAASSSGTTTPDDESNVEISYDFM
jgi:hypothetical protein